MADNTAAAVVLLALLVMGKQLVYSGASKEAAEVEALPQPEPLGRGLPLAAKRKLPPLPKPLPALPVSSFDRNLDAQALRAKLIDADAARRRAMTRVAQLEQETELLAKRCKELEKKAERQTANWFVQKLTKAVQANLHHPGGGLSLAWAAVRSS
ncbi:hypothetical protein BASA81_015372 [Batrachochytrium salamandrivorans]|nr:hypothetical protein BASA81_015372 [Batrachochytrium salamandrivorans]